MGELTPSEQAIMNVLRRAWPHTISAKVIREKLPRQWRAVGSEVVKVHVSHIRAKLGKDAILTFRGGYCVASPTALEAA